MESEPLSGEDIKKLLKGKVKIIEYPELSNYNSIEELLNPYGQVVILYESKPNYGHWTTLFKYPNRSGVEFFDPYGIKIDDEFNYISDKYRIELNEDVPYLSNLLYNYDGPIEYNDYKFQKFAENIDTCGRWVVLRLVLKKKSLEEFEDLFINGPKEMKIDRDKLVTYLVH